MSVLAIQTTVPGETVFFSGIILDEWVHIPTKKTVWLQITTVWLPRKKTHTAAKKKLLPRSSTETETKRSVSSLHFSTPSSSKAHEQYPLVLL